MEHVEIEPPPIDRGRSGGNEESGDANGSSTFPAAPDPRPAEPLSRIGDEPCGADDVQPPSAPRSWDRIAAQSPPPQTQPPSELDPSPKPDTGVVSAAQAVLMRCLASPMLRSCLTHVLAFVFGVYVGQRLRAR